MKFIDIENTKKTLHLKLEKLQSKKTIKIKEHELTINKLDNSISLLKSKLEDLDNMDDPRKKTIQERKKNEPHIYCKLCRKTYFGISLEDYKKLLMNNYAEASKTEYHKHREFCDDTCDNCGATFTSHSGKQQHKCLKVKEYENMKMVVTHKPTPLPPPPTPSPAPSIVSTVTEIESSSDEESLEVWHDHYNKTKYWVNKDNEVFDDYDEHIGYKYQDRLIHTDDELYEDFVDSF
jgi:hypothetical protein